MNRKGGNNKGICMKNPLVLDSDGLIVELLMLSLFLFKNPTSDPEET